MVDRSVIAEGTGMVHPGKKERRYRSSPTARRWVAWQDVAVIERRLMDSEQYYRILAVAAISAVVPTVVSLIQQALQRRAERNTTRHSKPAGRVR